MVGRLWSWLHYSIEHRRGRIQILSPRLSVHILTHSARTTHRQPIPIPILIPKFTAFRPLRPLRPHRIRRPWTTRSSRSLDIHQIHRIVHRHLLQKPITVRKTLNFMSRLGTPRHRLILILIVLLLTHLLLLLPLSLPLSLYLPILNTLPRPFPFPPPFRLNISELDIHHAPDTDTPC